MQTPYIVHKGMDGVLDVFGTTVEFLIAALDMWWVGVTVIATALRIHQVAP